MALFLVALKGGIAYTRITAVKSYLVQDIFPGIKRIIPNPLCFYLCIMIRTHAQIINVRI
jgi:hypothetical protein